MENLNKNYKMGFVARIIKAYKQSFAGLAYENRLLSLIMFINRCGTMVMTFISIYMISKLGFTLSQTGIVAALFGVGSLIGSWLGGKLTDLIGFRKVLLGSLFAGSIMFIITGYSTSYIAIAISVFLLGLTNEAFRPANSTAIAAYSKPENRTRSYSLHRFAVKLGFAAGTTFGGILAGINYKLLFWADAVTNIFSAIIVIFFLTPIAKTVVNNQDKNTTINSSPWIDKEYLRFLIGSTFFAIVFIQIFRMVPVYLKEHLHLNEGTLGLIMALNGLIITVFEMILIMKLNGKKSNSYFMKQGAILLAISYIFLYFTNLPAILIALLVVVFGTFSEIVILPFSNNFWVDKSNDSNRGAYAAAFSMTWSLANIIGPFLGALIADNFGFNWLWTALIACTLVIYLCFNSLEKQNNLSYKNF